MAKSYEMHQKEHAALFYGVERRDESRLRRLCPCGQPGKHAYEDRPNAYRCDACELAHVRDLHMQKRQHVIDLLAAILPANQYDGRRFDDSVPMAIAKVKALQTSETVLRAVCSHPATHRGRCTSCDAERGESPSGKALGIIQRQAQEYSIERVYRHTFLTSSAGGKRTIRPIHESGAGLAARYPDATTAAKPEAEIITCDLGSDWE